MTLAEVQLWGRTIGAVSLEDGGQFAAFEYDPAFTRSEIEVSPITMPLSDRVYVFSDLPQRTFHGLPGLLADSLPDRFGNALIDAWLATQGRTPDSFNAVERLCYIGARGMGELEFAPSIGPKPQQAKKIEIDALVKLASEVLTHRKNLKTTFASASRKNALNDILRVGTSAGGARAKAVIAWNRETNEVRSGQIVAGKGFDYWLLKFDGVTGNKDKELEDPKGYGAIEYAYYLMAKAAGIRQALRLPLLLVSSDGGVGSSATIAAVARPIEAKALANTARAGSRPPVRCDRRQASATRAAPAGTASGVTIR